MTTNVFDEIAPGWYNFRHHTIFKAELDALATRWQKGKLLNLGCGHGPDFLPFANKFQLSGVDSSAVMLDYARKYAQKFQFRAELTQADVRELSFKDNSFDWAIAVATYHHIAGEDERLKVFIELKRVLKPGGEAFITVWNRRQRRFWFKGKEVQVPWRQKDKTLYRYYYLFTYGEIEKLVKKTGFKIIWSRAESTYRCPVKYFSRNICLLVKKSA